ncbi:MAG: GGDEF domain-containing protein [Candidatus Rokubacteria bacterium]|nr:GGDEF domain-containing protein [Candidatus Rokubacteria bacterium]
MPDARDRLTGTLPTTSWIVFAAAAALAWRFKRSHLVLALAAVALATLAVFLFPPGRAPRDAVAIVLPLHLAALAWLPERPLFAARGRLRLVALGAEAGAVALLALPALAPVGDALAAPLVAAAGARAGALAQSGVIACALAVAGVAARLARRPRPDDAGLFWALLAAIAALAATDAALTVAALSVAGVALLVAVVEASYGMAYGDELTGLPARRALDSELRQLGGRYAIAMVDVDHFKKFNDEHGHPTGDQLLRMVATSLAGVGGGGRPFRYGGEEFAILFPGKATPDVLPHLEAVRKAIETAPFVVRAPDRPRKRPERPSRGGTGRRRVGVTVSIGVAAATRKTTAPREVLDAADAALYRAKHGGRNRVAT